MRWAMRRKMIYLGILLVPVALVSAYVAYTVLDQPATCFDGLQNQDEAGVDCGGTCARVCQAGLLSPVVSWSRAFPVSKNIYNAVAYVRNPNADLTARHVNYTFTLYDANNLLIDEVSGQTILPDQPKFPIFVGGIDTDGRTPARTTFDLVTKDIYWEASTKVPELSVESVQLMQVDTEPRLTATIINPSTTAVTDVRLVALVYNTLGNAIHASATYIDELSARSSEDVVFTWRSPFGTLRSVCPPEPLVASVGPCRSDRFTTDVVIFNFQAE